MYTHTYIYTYVRKKKLCKNKNMKRKYTVHCIDGSSCDILLITV